ncbi:MAG: hypothetical protein WCA37_11990 [Terracidiphilus sp.]
MEPEESNQPLPSETVAAETEIFEFVYEGPDVDKGSMDASEVAEVLTGLTRTFSIVASEAESSERLQLRVRNVEANSFHIIFEAIAFAKTNPAAATAIATGAAVALNAVSNAVCGAYRVVTDIAKVIDAKKRLKGVRIATQPTSFEDGSVSLTLNDDLLVLTKEQYELLLSQRVDKHLTQIISPLESKRIETFQMRRATAELVTVEAGQRDYFNYFEVGGEESKEGTQITGTFNSLSKSNLRGTFYTSDGAHVPYKYVGADVGQLLRGFTARELVRVHGRIKYGGDGVPTYIEVQNIDIVQRGIFEE